MESHQLHHSLQLTLPKIAMCSFAFPVKDRKSTRLNSSHSQISYAVFCLKKKKKNITLSSRFLLIHKPAELLNPTGLIALMLDNLMKPFAICIQSAMMQSLMWCLYDCSR